MTFSIPLVRRLPRPALRFLAAAAIGLAASCTGGGDRPGGTGVTNPDPLRRGSLVLTVAGLPAGVGADISLSGPAGFARALAAGATIGELEGGQYTVVARTVRTAVGVFAPSVAEQTAEVVAGAPARFVTVTYAVPAAVIRVDASGLPPGAAYAATLTTPGGQTLIGESTRIPGSTPGRYTLATAPVRVDGFSYAGVAEPAEGTLLPGDTLLFRLTHTLATGAVAVTLAGLPDGAIGTTTLVGPDGVTRVVNGNATVTDLPPGTYSLTSPSIDANGRRYRPAPGVQQVVVSASLMPTPVAVSYEALAGTLVVNVGGAPDGSSDMVRVTGPGGFTRLLSATTTLAGLAPGAYTLIAEDVMTPAATWRAANRSRQATVLADDETTVSFVYAIATGSLAVAVSGLPAGVDGAVTVSNASGFTRSLAASTTLVGLEPGDYTVRGANVASGAVGYGASPAVQTVSVLAGLEAAQAAVAYRVRGGSLAVTVAGAPGNAANMVRVTGPDGFVRSLSFTTSLDGLAPGTYTVVADPIVIGGSTWRGTPLTSSRTISDDESAAVTVTYGLVTGGMTVGVNGLPQGVSANVGVSGPGGHSSTLSGTSTLTGLAPGTYLVLAANVTAAGITYAPSPVSQNVVVTASLSPATSTVTYVATNTPGSVSVIMQGLPNGVGGVATLFGNGQNRTVTGNTTVTGLPAGTYTLSASNVSAAGTVYQPNPASQQVTLAAGASAAATVMYAAAPPPTSDDLAIDYVYLTQAVQRLDGTVPLAIGRDALVRVFVRNNRDNTLKPSVRVRVYDGASVVQTITLAAPEASTRVETAEGTLGSTWNSIIPGANIRSGLRVQAEVDPASLITDADRSNNVWPRGGGSQAVATMDAPTFTVRFVPVTTGALTGDVTPGNVNGFLFRTRLVHPIATVDAAVRLPFTSSAGALQSGDQNGGWGTVLSELNALRAADGVAPDVHYYGVVKVNYTSGVAGLGYVPGRSAIGWDYLPSGDDVASHEFGHNFARPHAPCGTAGEGAFPHSGGTIGVFGWDPTIDALVAPNTTDFMSYCRPNWVSDWTWTRVLQYRAASGLMASRAALTAGGRQDGLLVWGRIEGGRVTLEPAFRVTAPVTPIPASGAYRLQALDAEGATLLDRPIETFVVDHATNGEARQFAVVVPWSAALEARLAGLRVRDTRSPLVAVTRSSITAERTPVGAPPALPDAAVAIDRGGGTERLRWNGAAYPMAMVRDAATGQIVAFLRQSGSTLRTGGRAVDVVVSDGVRSRTERVR